MPYLVVENFNGGLDSRRSALVAKPGTLVKLDNGHITRGGEIEKRKSFVKAFDTNIQTFGLVAGKDTIYTFIWNPGGVHGQIIESGLAPIAGVSLSTVNIIHPFDSSIALTDVVSSTLFNGKPFCVAEFSNGDRYPYWNGNCLGQATGGVIPTFTDNTTSLCQTIAKVLNNGEFNGTESFESRADGYLYVLKDGKMVQTQFFAQYTTFMAGPGEPQSVYLYGPVGKEYEIIFKQTSNTLNAQNFLSVSTQVVQGQVATTPAKDASSSFTFLVSDEYQFRFSVFLNPTTFATHLGVNVFPVADGLIVKAISVQGNDLMAFDVTKTAGQTVDQFFQAVADSINNLTLSHGFTATSYAENGIDYGGVLVKETSTGRTVGNSPYSVTLKYPNLSADTVITSTGTNDAFMTGSMSRVGSVKMVGITKAKQGGGVTGITANGIEILGQQINYHGSMPEMVQSIANTINLNNGGHGYTAERSVSTIKISKPGANGAVISLTRHGSLTSSTDVIVAGGGSDAVVGRPQKTKITVNNDDYMVVQARDNDVEMGFQVTLTGDGKIYNFGSNRISGIFADIAFTYQGKGYLTDGSTFYFSALNDVTRWDVDSTGSGFIDSSNNLGIRDNITGLGLYQGKLAVFTRNDVQLWSIDPDPAQNRLSQSISNTGCIAPRSVTSFGSIDVFYLSDSGLRSLRARDSTDAAYMADVGHAIDGIIIEHLSALTNDQKANAVGFIDPTDGRYWLCIGKKIYVYSYFPGSNIAAWSTYDFQVAGYAPYYGVPPLGEDIDSACSCRGRVFIKAGSSIYIYGGESGNQYDGSVVTLELPYLDAQKPATYKEAKGIDATCEGQWKVYLGFDHTNPEARDLIATITQSTFALGRITATGIGTHFGPKIVSNTDGYARFANFIVHYDDMHSKHEAG